MDFASVEWDVFYQQMTNDFGEEMFEHGFVLIRDNRNLIIEGNSEEEFKRMLIEAGIT